MTLGPHIPQWNALAARLDLLVGATQAKNATVMDVWNDLWCRARPLNPPGIEHAFEILRQAERAHSGPPPERGGQIRFVHSQGEPYAFVQSFAAAYVLVLWFDGPFEPFGTRRFVERALPEIEALTTSLPPTDGPGVGAGAARQPKL